LVLRCDEKSQVQALERTQPRLPLGIGHIQTKSHDYTRPGTVTLFAALDYLLGKLISSIERQHRHQEWLTFLKKIDKETPKHLQLHLIVDNYATHKHAKVKAWLAKHQSFHVHFTPTSSSWMNMVERFFQGHYRAPARRQLWLRTRVGKLDYHLPGITQRPTDPVRLEREGRGNFEQDPASTRCDGNTDERVSYFENGTLVTHY